MIVLAIPMFLIFVIVLLFVTVPVINDFVAAGIVGELERLPIPEQTEIVDSISAAGNLASQGNKIQYFGAILIHSYLSHEELETHFSQFRENAWSVIVAEQTSLYIEFLRERERFTFNLPYETTPLENFFIVYSWGNTNHILGGFFDLRGH